MVKSRCVNEICTSHKKVVCYSHNLTSKTAHIHSTQHSLACVIMSGASVPQRRIETRAKNKLAHPGMALKATVQPRRTTAEVQQERAVKAQAKAAKEEAKQRSINRAAEFEHADMANEDIVDATPRPPFTPKLWQTSRSQKNTCLTPLTEMSDVEMAEDFDTASVEVPCSEKSITDDSTVESDNPPPPVKKRKFQAAVTAVPATAKAVSTAGVKPVGGRVAEKKKRAKDAEEVVPASDEELPEEPKLKKVKVKVRDEIDIAMKKIEKNKVQNVSVNTLKSSNHAGEDLEGSLPAPEALSQVPVGGKRKLKREGAIADIRALYEQEAPVNPDRSSKRSQQKDLMDNNNRYYLLTNTTSWFHC